MTERKALEEVRCRHPRSQIRRRKRDLANLMGQIGEPWLGMETTGNNDFKWIDGTSVSATFSAWKTGERNNPGVENCAYMYVVQKKIGKIIPAWMQCTAFFVRKRSKIIDFSAW